MAMAGFNGDHHVMPRQEWTPEKRAEIVSASAELGCAAVAARKLGIMPAQAQHVAVLQMSATRTSRTAFLCRA